MSEQLHSTHKVGWQVTAYCPDCDIFINFWSCSMLQNKADIGFCGRCPRPLVVIGDDGHLYNVGDRIVKNATLEGKR
jgi:hypothetical protein